MCIGYVMSLLWATFSTLPPYLAEQLEAEHGGNATTSVLFASRFVDAEEVWNYISDFVSRVVFDGLDENDLFGETLDAAPEFGALAWEQCRELRKLHDLWCRNIAWRAQCQNEFPRCEWRDGECWTRRPPTPPLPNDMFAVAAGCKDIDSCFRVPGVIYLGSPLCAARTRRPNHGLSCSSVAVERGGGDRDRR